MWCCVCLCRVGVCMWCCVWMWCCVCMWCCVWLCRVGVSVSLSVCMWCCVWLCRVGVCMWCCVCVCVVVCVCVLCGVSVGCVVLFFVCVCTCGVGEAWHAENPPCVYVQNASVCTVRTSPCVPATGPNVLASHFFASRSLLLLFSSLVLSLFLHVSFSFFSSLFSFLFSPLSSLSSSLSAHTETRSDRQVTPPTMNGHAPRDPLNQERSYQSVNPCYVTFWEFFAC